jgi:hypothetical protein
MKGQIVYSLDQGKHDAIEESFAKHGETRRRGAAKASRLPSVAFPSDEKGASAAAAVVAGAAAAGAVEAAADAALAAAEAAAGRSSSRKITGAAAVANEEISTRSLGNIRRRQLCGGPSERALS